MRHLIFFVAAFSFACNEEKRDTVVPVEKSATVDSLRPTQKVKADWPKKDKAHPAAQALMKDEWLFSTTDDNAPFGSDDGADTYASFFVWRKANPNANTRDFLQQHLAGWGYPSFDLSAKDYPALRSYLNENELSWRYLFGTDAAIIATAFGQLCLEGKLDKDLKEMALTAIERESVHEILQWWQEHRPEREKKLPQLKSILERAP